MRHGRGARTAAAIPRAEPPQSFGVNQIVHGDRSIIVIEQGAQKRNSPTSNARGHLPREGVVGTCARGAPFR
jgi:hypothetical protein